MKLRLKEVVLCVAVLLAAATLYAADETKTTAVESKYAGLSWGPLGRAVLAELPGGTLLAAGGLKVTDKDLSEEVAKTPVSLQAQLSQYAFFTVEQMATRKLLSIEAKAWGEKNKVAKELDQLIGAYLDSVASKVQVADQEVDRFRKENEGLLAEIAPDEQKSKVKRFLEEQKRSEAIENHVKSIGGRHNITVSSAWVDAEYQKWTKNPVEQARKSGKPSLVDFGAEWCMPCKQMAPIISSIREEYKDRVNVILVNTSDEPILATHYGANLIPLLVFYDRDGKEAFRHNSVLDKKSIEEKLKSLGS